MKDSIEKKCINKDIKLTDQRKIIAKVMSESSDHPDVDELYKRVSKIDTKISFMGSQNFSYYPSHSRQRFQSVNDSS